MERVPPPPTQRLDSGRWMTPSELGDYTWCPRAWWYSRQEGAKASTEALERGLMVQAELQEAHLANAEPRGLPWGTLAALCLVLVGGFVLWTFWW